MNFVFKKINVPCNISPTKKEKKKVINNGHKFVSNVRQVYVGVNI